MCKKLGIELIRIDNDDFIKNKDEIVSNVINFLNKKYNLSLKVDLTKVKNVIRCSGKCRKIICTDTMEIFGSYVELKNRFPDINIRNVLNVCNGKFSNYKGFHYQYYDENKTYTKTDRNYNYHYKHIKCIETGEIFNSISELEQLGVTAVWDCLNNKQKTASGLTWKYTNKNTTNTDKTKSCYKNIQIQRKLFV